MSKTVRAVLNYAGSIALQARAAGKRGRLIALFVLIALITTAAFSSTSSAKIINKFLGRTPLESNSIKRTPAPVHLNSVAQETPTINTDKGQYEPGETITFTGTNWTPGETVSIVLREESSESEGVTIQATADDNGSFIITAPMPEPGSGEQALSTRAQAANAPRSGEASTAAAEAQSGVIFTAVATGATSGATAQAQFKNGSLGEQAEDDADLPSFIAGKIDKEDYLRKREEHINKLRGIEPGKPFDAGARGKAISEMERQEHKGAPGTDGTSNMATGSNSSGMTVTETMLAAAGVNTTSWTSIGPAPLPNGQTFNVTQAVSGRVTAIALHPTNPNIAYVGAAQGGVYRTLDGGTTWTAIFDNAQSLAIGSIAIAPSQPSTIYVGTGEGNFSCDTYFGVGVYRIDNADSANPTLSGPFNKETSTGTDVLTGRSISKVLVHPTNPDIIFIASNSGGIGGIGCDAHPTQASSRGLYRSTNATSSNATFQRITTATANSGNRSVTDMEFEPGNPNTMLATVVGFSTAGDGGVYRSTNALAATPTFTQTLSAGSTTATARVELAINKVGSAVNVFAATTDSNGTLKRSIDGGQTWSAAISAATGFCGTQCFYDMPIALDPTNGNILYIGGNADGTSTAILKKSTNALATPSFTKVQTGLHSDSHAIEISPVNNTNIWFGSDGGVWKSVDSATNWTSLNNSGFNATQFQSIALHPTDANYTIGGTQDNGTERMKTDGTWTRTDYGDGGFALIDQNATNTTTVRQYHTYYNQVGTGGLVGFATTTSSTAFENWTFLGCGGTSNGLSCNDSAVEFYAPMALGPGNPNTLYFGTDRLYRSSNSGTTMTVVSQQFVSGVAVSAIGISPQSDAVRIVGLSNGKVYRTMTGGASSATMTDVTGTIPAKYVARAVIDPNNTTTAYVTLAGFFGAATSHIYKTTNLGAAAPTWTGIASSIPDVPVNAFVVDPADSNMLYAGTDIGVYRSTDGGATWSPFSTGLPRVAVFDMAIQNPNRILRIATHGRGMWDMSIPTTPGTLQGTVTNSTNGPISGATVTTGSNTATTDANGFYQITNLSGGTYSVTASAQGYSSNTANGVVVTSGGTTTQNFSLTTAPTSGCLTDTTQADFQAGTGTSVDLTNSPGDVQLTNSGSAVLDQSQTTTSFFVSPLNTTAWMAQTFVPGSSGQLSSIDIQLATATTGTAGPIIIEIRNTVGGAPGSTVLASTTSSDVSSTTNAWYPITFSPAPNVSSGTSYAIVLRAGTGGDYRAVRANSNAYANGAWYTSSNSGGAWTAQSQDLAFRTYITPVNYSLSGNLVSSLKDSNPAVGSSTTWTTLSWTATTPANTALRFQVAGSSSAAGPFNFVGPDGTSNTFFTTSGASLSQFNGSRYLKYKAYLSTTSSAATPTLSSVTLCYCTVNTSTSLSVAPATGTYGGSTNLSATLTSGGNGLSGQTVNFTLNGTSVGNAITNSSGVATLSNVSLSGINAGSYPSGVGASFTSANCYSGSTGSNSLNISKVMPTITWANPASIAYGTALDNTQLNATASVPGSFVYTPAAGTVLHAGNNQNLHADFTPTDTTNYNNASKDVSISVTKGSLTVKADDKSRAYGEANPTLTYTMTGFLNGDTQASATSGQPSITTAASNSSAPGTYTITAAIGALTSTDYSFSFVNGTLTVTKADQTINFGALAAKTYGDADFTLNATASSGLAVSFAASGKCTISGATVHLTGAGSCTITASQPGNANYNAAPDVAQSFSIAKADSTTSVSVSNATYDGQPHGGTASVSGFGGLSQSLTVTYSGRNGTVYGPSTTAPTNAGDYTASASYDGDADHNSSSNSKDYSIAKAPATISLSNLNQTYTGSPLAATANTSPDGLSGLTVTYDGSTTAPTNAGSYAVVASLNNQNYQADNATGTLTISKAAPTVTATGNTCTYSGSPCAGSGTATGINGADLGAVTLTYTPGGTAPVNAGSYTVVASIAETANHTAGSSAPASIIISKAAPTISVTVPSGPVTYDGNAHPATGFAYGVGGPSDVLTPAVTFTYNGEAGEPVNVNTYAVIASFAGNDNYLSASNNSASIVISKATPTVTITSGLGTFTYDANPHGATGSVKGVGGADLGAAAITYNGSSTAPVDAGSYTVLASFAGSENYNQASSEAGNITIGKATPVTSITGGTYTYDGSAHPASGSIKGVGGIDLGGVISYNTADNQAPVNAGSYTATISFAGNNNYNAASDSASILINKATPTITWSNPSDIVYGTALDATQLNATASVSGNFTYTPASGTVLNAGNGQVLHTSFTPTDAANYNNASKDVTINVSKASATISLSNLYYLYDGTAKSVTATTNPSGLSGVSVTYNGSATPPSVAGSYAVVASLANANYTASNATGTLIINTAPIAKVKNVTVNSDASCTASGAATSVNNGSSDPDSNPITITQTPSGPYALGTTTVTLTVKDSYGATSTQTATVTVLNPNPAVTITAPAATTVVTKGSAVSFAGAYTDNPGSAYAATWTLKSGTQTINQPGTINTTSGTIGGSYTFANTGVYLVTLTLTDGCGGTGTATQVGGVDAMVAVYDPSSTGGSVSTTTKAPTIFSPAGAYPANPTLTGSATTGFNASYPSATATAPTGQAVFNFVAANLNFSSTSYQWMTVTRPYVWLRGSGTVNNQSGYEFLISAVDGQLTGGGGADKFRIRIWNKSTGAVVYDNLTGAALNVLATTTTSNGDIAIK